MAGIPNRRTTVIREFCMDTHLSDPVKIALQLMRHEDIRLHGPEHHYLTAAALCAAYCNVTGRPRSEWLRKLEIRCNQISAGVCGYYGVCGNASSAGAFVSVVLGTTHLSGQALYKTGLMASRVLDALTRHSGPRCCKRVTYSALIAGAHACQELLDVQLDRLEMVRCEYSQLNSRECLHKACEFFG